MCKEFFVLILLGLVPFSGQAQELNIGAHLNPVLTKPLIQPNSVYDKEVRPSFITLGYGAGINLNYKYGKIGVETGVNYVQKSIRFTERKGGDLWKGASYYVSLASTALEFPLTFSYNIFHNDKRTNYDLYVLGGVAYEINTQDGSGTGSSSGAGVGNLLVDVKGRYAGSEITGQTITPIIGFKIHAVLRNVGLIEYGLSYHVPLKAAGPYTVEASLNRDGTYHAYTGSFYAQMSYLDIKLCYYFLSLTDKFRRVRYRMGG